MSTKDDGGPAFPLSVAIAPGERPRTSDDFVDGAGMSLRDYIAIKAMSGSLAGVPGPHLIPESLARDSYAHADAMLAERAK